MKQLLALLAALCLAAALAPVGRAASPAPPQLQAEAAVLVYADTGQVLYGKEEQRRMQPASLTKLMTLLLAMEDGDPSAEVEMTAEGLDLPWDSSSIWLSQGERLTMEQMLYAMMLPSANDAANAVAIHLGGTLEEFTRRMNRRAVELGLNDTHFANPNGLTAPGHYSSALDLARLTRAAMEHPSFFRYAGTDRYFVPASSWGGARWLIHLDKMLQAGSPHYREDVIAGKTGYTRRAGHCLMTVARRGEITLIAVVLKSGAAVASTYEDTAALLDYGFENFRRVELELPAIEGYTFTASGVRGEELELRVSCGQARIPALLPPNVGGRAEGLRLPAIADWSQADLSAIQGEILMRTRQGEELPWPVGYLPLTVELVEVDNVVEDQNARYLRQLCLWLAGLLLLGLPRRALAAMKARRHGP